MFLPNRRKKKQQKTIQILSDNKSIEQFNYIKNKFCAFTILHDFVF